jgi:hypothetical protein
MTYEFGAVATATAPLVLCRGLQAIAAKSGCMVHHQRIGANLGLE